MRIEQIILLIIFQSGGNLQSSVVTSYQIIRVLRLVRFMSLLKRLYATAVAASSAMLPGLNVGALIASSIAFYIALLMEPVCCGLP